jgi:hypothetical protein
MKKPSFKKTKYLKRKDHIKIHAELAEFYKTFNVFLEELDQNVNFFTFEHTIENNLTNKLLKNYISSLNKEFMEIPNIDFTLIIPSQINKTNQLILKIYIGIRKQTTENRDIAVPFFIPTNWKSISIINDFKILEEIKIVFFVNLLHSFYFYSFTSFNSCNIEIHNKYKKLFPSAIFKQIYNDYTNRDFLEDY